MDKYIILLFFNILNNMELNLLIIIIYLIKTLNIPKLKKKNFYDNIKTNFHENSKFIFEINIDNKKCNSVNYNNFGCKIFNIEQNFLDNYDSNYSFIIEIINRKEKNQYNNLVFINNLIKFYKKLFINLKLKFCLFFKIIFIYLKYLRLCFKYINDALSKYFPINMKINLDIIKILCEKEKSLILFEITTKNINIIILYFLNFSLILIGFII